MNARTLTRAAAQRPITAAGTLVDQRCPSCGAVVRKAGSVIYDWQIDECPRCYSLVMFTMGNGGGIKRKLLPYRNKVAGHIRSSGEQTDQDHAPQSGMRADNNNRAQSSHRHTPGARAMNTYTINVHSHKTLAIVATITTTGYGVTDAMHAAVRAAMAQGHTWDQHGGLFARVAP